MDPVKEYIRSRDILLEEGGIKLRSKYVRTRGPVDTVHYLELGSGKPLILIHGGGSHASEWLPILNPLAEHFHLYVLDRPGCGLTDPIDYRGVDVPKSATAFIGSFLDAVGLGKASFLLQSMGGYFGACFAMEHPEKVEKLVFIGAPAGMNFWIPLPLRLLGTKGLNRVLVKTIAKPSLRNVRTVYRQLLVADVGKLSDTYIRHCYLHQLLPGSETGFLSLLENVLTMKGWRKELYIGDQLHRLRVPVSFIWGDQDAFEHPDRGKKKASVLKDCRFEVVEKAGHCPWLDQPERCSALAIAMLRE